MLREDHNKFQVESGGDTSKAKEHNNVIMPYLLDIPLDMVSLPTVTKGHTHTHTHSHFNMHAIQVCLPGLHISLGVSDR